MKQWIERALAAGQSQADINLRMFVGSLAALTVMWTGLYARAAQLLEALRAMSTGPGVTPFSLITLKNIETMYAMFIADGAACGRAMREGLEIAQATGVHTWTFQLLVWGYGGALGAGDLGAAAAIAKQLEPLTGQAGRFNLCVYRHFQAWDALLRKDLMDALQKEKAALRMAVEVGCPLYEALCRLGLAGILADCGDERRCISHLRDAAQHRARHRQPPSRVHLPHRLRADRARRTAASAPVSRRCAARWSLGASTATSTSWDGSRRRWRACSPTRWKPASSPTTRGA